MWSQYKPPITNRLVLKFFNYWKKKIIQYKLKLDLLILMASEINSIFLKKNWIFDWSYINCFFFLENLNFCSISLPLNYLIISKNFFFKKNYSEFTFSNIKNNLLINSMNFFFDWNILNFGWSSNLDKNYNFNTIFLKTFIFSVYSNIWNVKLLNFWMFDYNFFYNYYYYTIIIFFFLKKFNPFEFSKLNKVYYYGFHLTTTLIQNFFEFKIKIYNKYLSMQKGFSKKSFVFINWHYLFSTSTQISKFSINNFYKTFYKTFYKILNKKFINFIHKKKISWKFDKLTSKSGIFLWARQLPILPQYVNKIFYVYNGARFFKLRIVPAMIGYKFGSFSFTRRILAKDYKIISSFKNIV